VPPADRVLPEAPAQADLTAIDEGGEVDEAALDVAQRDAEGVDAAHGRLHLVDDPLHPQPESAEFGLVDVLRCGLVTEADEFGALVA